MADWYDHYTVTARRNLARLLDGTRITVTGDPENGQSDTLELCVERVTGVTIGIDSKGVFAGIEVEASVGPFLPGANPLRNWTLYADGNVADSNDHTVGRHALTSKPDPVGAH